MARDVSDATPIESRAQLIETIASGGKPKAAWRVGTEHEKFGFYLADHSPVPYDGDRGIRRLLEAMEGLLGWHPIVDGTHIIGLTDPTGQGAISLEPGGQFELSGAPLSTIHQTAREVNAHLAQVRECATPLGIGFLGAGFSPLWTRSQTPVMPKSRYAIMARYMPKVGGKGLDMMFRTCTIQANLDFADEADMVKKMRVGLALQPVVTALFANSPFTEGKPNGYQSYRSEIWLDTDRNRTGMLPFAFERGFGFEQYVDWALDVPMYFVKRGDHYHDVAGASFRDLMAGKLEQLPDERATQSDWMNHLSTLFPEVRLKKYLEMRGADGGEGQGDLRRARLLGRPDVRFPSPSMPQGRSCRTGPRASASRCVTPSRSPLSTPRSATAPSATSPRRVVALAKAGLVRRANKNREGNDESIYLAPVEETLESGKTPADRVLDEYENEWNGDIDKIFTTHAY